MATLVRIFFYFLVAIPDIFSKMTIIIIAQNEYFVNIIYYELDVLLEIMYNRHYI